MARQRYIQDPKTLKLVPAEEYFREKESRSFTILDDIEPFVSPVDGSTISSRSALREHNKRHGVTNVRDYGEGWFERKAKERDDYVSGRSERAKQERLDTIQRALHKHGVY